MFPIPKSGLHHRLSLVTCLTAATVLLGPTSTAAVLLEYQFAGGSTAPTFEAAGVSGSALTVSSGSLVTNPIGSNFGPSGAEAVGTAVDVGTEGFVFTITPGAGVQFTLTSLVLYTGKNSSPSNQLADLDLTGAIAQSYDDSIEFDRAAGSADLALRTVALVGASDLSDAVTFTIDLTGVNADSYQIDDVQVIGEVSIIPEPASMALLGAGALCLMSRRRHGT